MDRYRIYYESKDGKMRVNDADLPSEEVKAYFIKESTYYDQHTASFRSQVTALCPVLKRGDTDFGGELAQYPMFWVTTPCGILRHILRCGELAVGGALRRA